MKLMPYNCHGIIMHLFAIALLESIKNELENNFGIDNDMYKES